MGTFSRHDETTRRHLRRLDLCAHDVTTPFCCGGEIVLDATPTLRFPRGHSLPLDFERNEHRIIETLKRRCKEATFGEGGRDRRDRRVRDALQLTAAGGAVTLEGFDPARLGMLDTVRAALCPRDPNPLRAEFYAVNVYSYDGHFARHKDTPRGDDMIGSLVVVLGSPHQGGELVVSHRGATETFSWNAQRYGAPASRSGHWAAFFGDVDHEVRRVFSGERVSLTFTLRRTEGATLDVAAPHSQTDLLADAFAEALADEHFLPLGGTLGFSCFHLYAEAPGFQRGAPDITAANAGRLKGRDQHVAAAALRLGLAVRFVPYLVEACAEQRWALDRFPSTTERMLFRRARLTYSDIEDRTPARGSADDDDVTWVVVPRLDEGGPLQDGATAELLGEVEYSGTGYFGNEGGPGEFYTHAALIVEVPAKGKRTKQRPVAEVPARATARKTKVTKAPSSDAPGTAGELLTAAQLRERGVTDARRKALLASGVIERESFGWYRIVSRST